MDQHDQKNPAGSDVEFVKGCPICERSDPQLERELQEFAQLLFEITLADQMSRHAGDRHGDIDKII